MAPIPGIRSTIWSSILLALLTVIVFASEQRKGPESSVRAFQEAVLTNDLATMKALVIQPLGTLSVSQLRAEVLQLRAWGAVARITRTTRIRDHVVVDAQYTLPNGRLFYLAWVLRREKGIWRVDADQTQAFVTRSFGFY